MVTTSPPATYLPSGVTDLNRQSLWNAMTAEQQAKYSGSSTTPGGTTGTGTSGTGTSGTGTTGGTSGTGTTNGKVFVSHGSTTQLSSSAFKDRTDSRSAAPPGEAITGFSKLWAGEAAVQAQLTLTTDPDTGASSAVNGGAIFVRVRMGTAADGSRPYNGVDGPLDPGDPRLARGENPYGYFSVLPTMKDTPFVKRSTDADGNVVDTVWSESTGQTYKEWEKSARYAYDEYDALIGKQQETVLAGFGGTGSFGLLGFDVNNNGYIDNESELFGFDGGLNLNNMPPGATEPTPKTIKSADLTEQTRDIMFLTDGRLTGDPMGPADSIDREIYGRFMLLNGDGTSTSLLQSSIGYNTATNQYVAAQTSFTFGPNGATLTAVAQNGFKVTA